MDDKVYVILKNGWPIRVYDYIWSVNIAIEELRKEDSEHQYIVIPVQAGDKEVF